LLGRRAGSKFITALYHIPLTNSNREYDPEPLPEIKGLDDNKRYIPGKYDDECEEEVNDSESEGEYSEDNEYESDREWAKLRAEQVAEGASDHDPD
jgi:hypothetical protein